MIKTMLVAAMINAQSSAPPPAACITRQQVSDMVIVMAPSMIDGVRNQCGSHLDATAFVMGPAARDMSERLRRAGEGRIDSAVDGFLLFSGEGRRPPRNVSRAMLVAGLSAGLAESVLGDLNARACRDANDLVESMSPLSADQVGRMFGAIMSLASRNRRPGEPPICQD